MSKKQNQKKKISIKINAGEAAFVAKLDTLNHIANTYFSFSNESKTEHDRVAYYEIATSIQEWSAKTYFNPEDGYDDEEW
jgi:hypothetical protein